MDKLQMQSKNLVDENIEFIAKRFPNCVTEALDEEGKLTKLVDFDMLKQELSRVVIDGDKERYTMTWPDKKQAILTANAPIAKTLRPCREESVDFDHTQNLYIEGDNLDVLKLLRETYLGKIKMIYIDPPYNTGKDFIYEDDFSIDSEEYLKKSNQMDDQGNRLFVNNEMNGRFHTDWLNMMFPRLKLARDLMSDDGIIFISIDDNEMDNLKKICNEIFGEENLLSTHHIQVRYGQKSLNERKDFQELIEYVFIYAKNKHLVQVNKPKEEYPLDKFNLKITHTEEPTKTVIENGRKVDVWDSNSFSIDKVEPDIEGFKETWISGSILTGTGHGTMYLKCVDKRRAEDGDGCLYRIWGVGEDGLGYRYYTNPQNESANRGKMYTKIPLAIKEKVKSGEASKDSPIINFYDFSGDFGNIRQEGGVAFNAGKKPIKMLKQFINYLPYKDFIVLDFFSGSASTAHAVMSANAEDGGKRKFIMVQIPEDCNENSDAYKEGFKTICDLGKTRIKNSGAKINENNNLINTYVDVGFRDLKLDSSCMKDIYYSPNKMTQDLLTQFEDNIKEDRTPEDLLFQVMLDMGVMLSSEIKTLEINGKKVFNVNDGDLVCCFDKDLNETIVTAIAKMQPLYAVFRDASMSTDSIAVNFDQIFETYSPTTTRKII